MNNNLAGKRQMCPGIEGKRRSLQGVQEHKLGCYQAEDPSGMNLWKEPEQTWQLLKSYIGFIVLCGQKATLQQLQVREYAYPISAAMDACAVYKQD